MAKVGSYRWEGREKILRALRDDARAQVEEALAELDQEGVAWDYMDFEEIVGAVLTESSVTETLTEIINDHFWDKY
jgi:DNA-binding transcriptional ArsR family regulator